MISVVTAFFIFQKELTELQPTLDKASKDVSELLVVLEKDQAEALIVRESCAKDAEECKGVTVKVATVLVCMGH